MNTNTMIRLALAHVEALAEIAKEVDCIDASTVEELEQALLKAQHTNSYIGE